MADKTTIAIRELPHYVTATTPFGPHGLAEHNAKPLAHTVGEVVGAYIVTYDDGSNTPAFVVKVLETGRFVNVAVSVVRAVEPGEYGEWERTNKLNEEEAN